MKIISLIETVKQLKIEAMKTIRTLILALVASFATSYVMASGGLRVDFSNSEKNVTLIEMSNTVNTIFEINLMDASGNRIYSLETTEPGNMWKKKFDFSNLEDGTYWFSVDVNNEKTVKKLNIEKGNVTIEMIRKSIQPFFTKDGEMLKLSFLNPHQEDVNLYVYGANRQVLAEAELGNGFSIHKAVDLSKLRFGDYHVVLANDMDIYEYKFTVR